MSDLPDATKYYDLVNANPDMKARIWSSLVLHDSRSRNHLREFIGSEGSGKPIIEKTDLSKGGAEEVVFTTMAPVRGQGVLGETQLKDKTHKLRWGTFKVAVDLMRHAVSFSQLVDAMRKLSPHQASAMVMREWYGRKEEDDCQTRLRNRALLEHPENLVRVGGHSSNADLLSEDTMNTSIIEEAKAKLIAQGAKELEMQKDASGADVPQYVIFAPDQILRPLRRSNHYQQALRDADNRGDRNRLFSGKYAMWEGVVVYPHNVKIDSADGRQGSPLQPKAFLGTALSGDSATQITGGGAAYAAGISDYFAYFPGFGWKITDNEQLPDDTKIHYAIIYNLTGDDAGKYEGISYEASGNDGNRLTNVTRGVSSILPDTDDLHTYNHPSGSLIIPCTENGQIYGYALAMGAEALFHARGKIPAEPIFHWDDFKNSKGEAHLSGVGMQAIRGMNPYRDTIGRLPNFLLIEAAYNIPGVKVKEVA